MANEKYKALVVVESPTKVKKISSFLGKDYKVMASVGHVRDLPSSASDVPAAMKKEKWTTLGVNVEDDFKPLYLVSSEKKKVVQEIKKAAEESCELLIATDEDREGESIGWHLVEVIKPRMPVKRMVFSEITKEAIQAALTQTRQLNLNLVNAQETRRILDRLYGYTLSPLLWKKIARGLSAGRVQSVAVRLLVQRELERLAFRSGTYWDLKAVLSKKKGERSFEAGLFKVGGKRVAEGRDFDESTGKLQAGADVLLLDQASAEALVERVKASEWTISNIETKAQIRRPYPPFTTSSLQQEANRKLGFTARRTMQVAQGLYENGHITYMRTDSVNLSGEALKAARDAVLDRYGKEYLSPEPRQFQNKSKNAQEAHEAIRPAGTEMKKGEELGLAGEELKLYDMIWKRTMATQMAEARVQFETVFIAAADAEFRVTGKKILFPGFFKAYVEDLDDPEAKGEDQETELPELTVGEALDCSKVEAFSHETKPPSRYTEASLVKALEEKGIGRPSTYASIIGTIQDRGYVRKFGTQLVPTFVAVAVTRLLEQNFPKLVDYNFTAKMEDALDEIAAGEAEGLPYLKAFYQGDEGLGLQVKQKEEKIDARSACTLNFQNLDYDVRVGRYGPYFEVINGETKVTAGIPETVAPGDLNNLVAQEIIANKEKGPQSFGNHPETGLPIFLMRGPYGPYIQMGEVKEGENKPKRVGIPKTMDANAVDLEKALALLKLPRNLGPHPLDGKPVYANTGRFGPYVSHDGKFKSIPKDQDVLTIELNAAVELVAQSKSRAAAKPIKELGKHPEDGEAVGVYDGKYGPYVKHKKTNATVPKETDPQSVTLEQALDLLKARAAKGKKKSTRGKRKKAADEESA
jgi:DNA topoisomerase-1